MIEICESKRVARALSDLDILTQDRQSFVTYWSKLLETGMKTKDSCNPLEKKQLEKVARMHLLVGQWFPSRAVVT